MKIDKKKISGLSLLEALVSTAIIGIGFVAIFQMTNYSVQSIYTSGERTKANYLTSLIAEDVIGNKKIKTGSARSFSDFLSDFRCCTIGHTFGYCGCCHIAAIEISLK